MVAYYKHDKRPEPRIISICDVGGGRIFEHVAVFKADILPLDRRISLQVVPHRVQKIHFLKHRRQISNWSVDITTQRTQCRSIYLFWKIIFSKY